MVTQVQILIHSDKLELLFVFATIAAISEDAIDFRLHFLMGVNIRFQLYFLRRHFTSIQLVFIVIVISLLPKASQMIQCEKSIYPI